MKKLISLLLLVLFAQVSIVAAKGNLIIGDKPPKAIIERVHAFYVDPPANMITFAHKMVDTPYWMMELIWGETLLVSTDGLTVINSTRGKVDFRVFVPDEENVVEASTALNSTYSSEPISADVETMVQSAIRAVPSGDYDIDLSKLDPSRLSAYHFTQTPQFWYLRSGAGDLVVDVANSLVFVSEASQKKPSVVAIDTRGKQGVVANDTIRRIITEEAVARISNTIDFVAPEEKRVLYVFTDPYCGYCAKLHRAVASFNEEGTTIKYLPINNFGERSKEAVLKLLSVTSSKQANALDHMKARLSKRQTIDYDAIGALTITGQSRDQLSLNKAIGNILGVRGTPAVFDVTGNRVTLKY